MKRAPGPRRWLALAVLALSPASFARVAAAQQPAEPAPPEEAPSTPSTPPAPPAPSGSAEPSRTNPSPAEPTSAAPSPAEPRARADAANDAAKADDQKLVAGWIPGTGFALRSPDDQWRLRIGFQSAIRGQVIFQSRSKPSLANPFLTLRPILEGSLYRKWIRYWTSLELAANPVYLLDSYVEVQPVDAIGLRIGQQWTPFSRHEAIYGPHQLLMPEWSAVADYFWTGRDKGVTLFGSFLDQKVDYAIGAYIGSPLRQFTPIRGNYSFIARFGLSPKGPVGSEFAYAEGDTPAPFRYAIGVNGATANRSSATENFNPSTFKFETVSGSDTTLSNSIGADFFLQSSRFVTQAEAYVRRTNPSTMAGDYTSAGAWIQLGTLVYRRDVDIATRLSWADVNLDADHDTAFGVEVASTWYVHAPNVMIRARYAYGSQQTPASPDGTSNGAPLILPPGGAHIMTAQINTAF